MNDGNVKALYESDLLTARETVMIGLMTLGFQRIYAQLVADRFIKEAESERVLAEVLSEIDRAEAESTPSPKPRRRRNKPWTAEDDETLLQMWLERRSVNSIARKLGRTRGAIYTRLSRNGLSNPAARTAETAVEVQS